MNGFGNYLGTESNPIPYALTAEEIDLFLSRHRSDTRLQAYLLTCDPPYGIIVYEGVAEFLVWHPASVNSALLCEDITQLRITDVTFMPIVKSVNMAPYESPDQSFIDNLVDQVKKVSEGIASAIESLIPIAVLVLVLMVVREVKR